MNKMTYYKPEKFPKIPYLLNIDEDIHKDLRTICSIRGINLRYLIMELIENSLYSEKKYLTLLEKESK